MSRGAATPAVAGKASSGARPPLPPVQEQRVSTIARNGQRMLQLVNTLLDFSRLESGRSTSAFRRTDVSRLISELVAMFQSAAERAGLRLRIACDAETTAYVDRDSGRRSGSTWSPTP